MLSSCSTKVRWLEVFPRSMTIRTLKRGKQTVAERKEGADFVQHHLPPDQNLTFSEFHGSLTGKDR